MWCALTIRYVGSIRGSRKQLPYHDGGCIRRAMVFVGSNPIHQATTNRHLVVFVPCLTFTIHQPMPHIIIERNDRIVTNGQLWTSSLFFVAAAAGIVIFTSLLLSAHCLSIDFFGWNYQSALCRRFSFDHLYMKYIFFKMKYWMRSEIINYCWNSIRRFVTFWHNAIWSLAMHFFLFVCG